MTGAAIAYLISAYVAKKHGANQDGVWNILYAAFFCLGLALVEIFKEYL